METGDWKQLNEDNELDQNTFDKTKTRGNKIRMLK